MVVSLMLVLLAFEWKSPKSASKMLERLNDNLYEEDFTKITVQLEKPLMPLPKIVQVFKAVDNQKVIDEKVKFQIENPEDGFNEPDFFVDFKQEEIIPEDTVVYKFPTKYPEFPGGESALFSFLSENLKYTRQAREINLEGTVHVSFIVGKDGSIRNVKILRGLGAGLDEEVIRVIQSMPNWIPGNQGGRNVNVELVVMR